ncbi:MAG: S46 family peptidase [Gemmatimonadetes bacterium]|nr:S46 family peptidase [Gemmatimonadota bacterium]
MAAEPDEAVISEVADPALDTVQAGIFDNGKMWTFEYPPLDYLRTTYGFSADEEWFRRAHLSALRIPSCSASFVSASGLVMTNHHCARGSIEQVSREGEDLVADGFYAATLEDERPIEDYYADQLIEIRDVTDRVYAGLEGVTGTQERADRRQEVTDEIVAEITEEFGGEDAGFNVEMVELYAGGRYSVYIFRRYTDLRLVISPELQVAYFGGDYDNFTYPRYDLDMTFYRVYDDNGEPLQTEFYFPFSEEGVSEGDLVFVIGNPGSTSRLQTVAELEYRRDVSDQSVVDLLKTRLVALHEYAESHPEEAREMDLRNTIFGFENSLKAYTGIVGGLHDPVKIAKRKDHERRFQAAIDADPDLQAEYGDLIPRMAELQAQKREHDAALSSFLAVGHPQLGSSTMARAFAAFQYMSAQSQGAPPEMVDELKDAIVATPDQPREINEAQLAQRFHDFIRNYGPDHPFVQGILEGRTPEGMAAVIMDGSMLADSATAVAALNTGGLSMDDPAVRIVLPIAQALGPAQQVQAMVTPEETEISSALGRALFEVYGTSVPPDATFSLRIADGVVQDYEYNGTVAPVYTTYYGMYDHYYSYGAGSDWDLPELWLSPPESFDLSTPLNFVSTADIIGGNSGSPVIDQNLQVVGLIFDGNIESLPGDYIYLPVENRAVAVDARGMLEALEEIYQADRIFQELVSGVLVGGN